MILIDASHLSASRPNRPLFADVSITLNDGDRLGVVGINGSGKSTLLNMLARTGAPSAGSPSSEGQVRWGRGARVGVLGQQPQLPDGTVAQAVGRAWQAEAMLQRLGMGDMHDAPTSELSGGQAKRVALALLLAGEHEALILDEPTNHLDLDAVTFLEEWLAAYRGALVMVTHDRHVLDRVTTRVLELDRGSAYMHVPANVHGGSGYAAYLDGRSRREAQAENAEQVRRNLAKTELAWLRRGAPARTRKPKARIASATALVETRADAPARAGELSLDMGSQRLGSRGVELRGVGFEWPSGGEVLRNLSLELEPGDRIGIVGPNGAGKSTMLDLIAGRLNPTAGEIVRGATVKIGYSDQLGRKLDLNQRVREAVAGDKGEPSLADVSLMRRFWFDGDAQFAPISTLSGGERRRLQLLLTLVEQPNVLLLDEPTNDLDLDTLRALEDMLESWPGIAVVVSHDRAFLDRTTEQIVAISSDGHVREIRGGVAGWLAERALERTAERPRTAKSVSNNPASTAPAGGRSSSPRASFRSSSTVRRELSKAERSLASAVAQRDQSSLALADVSDHRDFDRLGHELAELQSLVDVAEEKWLRLATEAEDMGLEP